MKIAMQAVLGAVLVWTMVGCGDASPTKPAAAKPKASGVVTPEKTAAGTEILAFDFVDEDPCPSCVGKVKTKLDTLSGIKNSNVEKGKKTFTVEYDPQVIDANKLAAALKNVGEGVVPHVE